jgi:two-component system chemotaxis response regulator CheB
MDIDMPIMNGLEATAEIARASSVPVLIFTHNMDPELPFKALELGAADFLLKPDFSDLNRPEYVGRFIDRLRAIASRRSRLPAFDRSPSSEAPPLPPRADGAAAPSRDGADAQPVYPSTRPAVSVIVLGASTGGPQAVSRFLSGLKPPFPLPIALVQHIETGFDRGYADWLSDLTGHRVVLAESGMKPAAGAVYVAPTDRHLLFARSGFVLDDGTKVLNQKPSVDVLFRSAAELYGGRVLGVLLTGMGSDGAEGCAAIVAGGGFTVAQDETSSLIFGMPRAAILRGAASLVLPLDRIAPFVASAAEGLS